MHSSEPQATLVDSIAAPDLTSATALKPAPEGSLIDETTSRIIEMAWEDRTPFEAIQTQFGLTEPEVIKLMRKEMKASSFRMWRARVSGRRTKHLQVRPEGIDRGYCSRQYKINSKPKGKR